MKVDQLPRDGSLLDQQSVIEPAHALRRHLVGDDKCVSLWCTGQLIGGTRPISDHRCDVGPYRAADAAVLVEAGATAAT